MVPVCTPRLFSTVSMTRSLRPPRRPLTQRRVMVQAEVLASRKITAALQDSNVVLDMLRQRGSAAGEPGRQPPKPLPTSPSPRRGAPPCSERVSASPVEGLSGTHHLGVPVRTGSDATLDDTPSHGDSAVGLCHPPASRLRCRPRKSCCVFNRCEFPTCHNATLRYGSLSIDAFADRSASSLHRDPPRVAYDYCRSCGRHTK